MKKIFLVLLMIFSMSLVVACGNKDIPAEAADMENASEDVKDLFKELNVEYMGGLYARSETNDMMIAFFKSSGKPVVVITEYGAVYYGEYITKDATLPDGTKYTAITVEDETYGYHFDEDLTGFVVDRDKVKYEAKKLDVSVAADMLNETL